MLRRLLAILIALTILIPQVSVAFACTMMGEAPMLLDRCCCDPAPSAERVGEDEDATDCCEEVAVIADGPGNQVAHRQVPAALPDHEPQTLPPVLLPALFALLLPPPAQAPAWDTAHHPGPHGTDLYLRTHRLRL